MKKCFIVLSILFVLANTSSPILLAQDASLQEELDGFNHQKDVKRKKCSDGRTIFTCVPHEHLGCGDLKKC